MYYTTMINTLENDCLRRLCVGLCFDMHYLCPFWFVNHLDEEERAGCFAFIVFWISWYCKCPVALLHGAGGWSAVLQLWYSLIILTYFFAVLLQLNIK